VLPGQLLIYLAMRSMAPLVTHHSIPKSVVKEMTLTFKNWGDQWLKYATVATWFANFLSMESGRVLLPQGIQQLSQHISSFADSDWERGESDRSEAKAR
jgi:hypothetical protein